jgi:hypothetical protein
MFAVLIFNIDEASKWNDKKHCSWQCFFLPRKFHAKALQQRKDRKEKN